MMLPPASWFSCRRTDFTQHDQHSIPRNGSQCCCSSSRFASLITDASPSHNPSLGCFSPPFFVHSCRRARGVRREGSKGLAMLRV